MSTLSESCRKSTISEYLVAPVSYYGRFVYSFLRPPFGLVDFFIPDFILHLFCQWLAKRVSVTDTRRFLTVEHTLMNEYKTSRKREYRISMDGNRVFITCQTGDGSIDVPAVPLPSYHRFLQSSVEAFLRGGILRYDSGSRSVVILPDIRANRIIRALNRHFTEIREDGFCAYYDEGSRKVFFRQLHPKGCLQMKPIDCVWFVVAAVNDLLKSGASIDGCRIRFEMSVT